MTTNMARLVFKNLCVPVLGSKVGSHLEGQDVAICIRLVYVMIDRKLYYVPDTCHSCHTNGGRSIFVLVSLLLGRNTADSKGGMAPVLGARSS